MARTNHNPTTKIYFNIVDGKFAEKVAEGTAGAVSRINKKDVTVWEIHNDRLSGTLTEMKIEKSDYGKQLTMTMTDVAESYIITVPVESKYFDSFCAKIGNADLSKPMELAPYSFLPKDSGTKRTGMNIYQDGQKIDFYYTKDDPKGKPMPEKEKMDDDDWKMYKLRERKFYMEMIEKLKITSPSQSALAEKVDNDPNSDLPF